MRTRGWIALALAATWAVAGCDNAPEPPKNLPVVEEHPTTAPVQARPTTQELLTGPTKQLNLNVIPFSITVPQSWEVKSVGDGHVSLQGPTPAGDVQIQLAKRHNQLLTKEDVDALLRAAKKDADSHPESKRTAELRTMSSFRILDRQSIGSPISLPVKGADGKPTVIDSTPYQWTLLLLLPRGTGFEAYELNFYDLTLEQVKADKEFLTKILDTIIDEPVPGV